MGVGALAETGRGEVDWWSRMGCLVAFFGCTARHKGCGRGHPDKRPFFARTIWRAGWNEDTC